MNLLAYDILFSWPLIYPELPTSRVGVACYCMIRVHNIIV